MAVIAVVGGTGTLGAPVVRALAAHGHEVRVLSRRSPTHPVDLTSGRGLDAALGGCEVVIDAANAPPSGSAEAVLVAGSRRLLEAGARAGVRHHVCASIVGIERVPMRYYRVKVAQEEVVVSGEVAWTILRATQFHALVARQLAALARFRILPDLRARLQPGDAAEVAAVLAGVAVGEPRRDRVTVAGPEVLDVGQLARVWRAATGRRALLVPAPLPGRLGRALRAGGLTEPRPDHLTTTTFAEWLQRDVGVAR